jgi:hypothetical protein
VKRETRRTLIVNERNHLDTRRAKVYTHGHVGKLDQFAKEVFAEETPGITDGGATFQPPSELNLSEVRLDGMLLVRDPARIVGLPAPWSEASPHDEVVLELKMQGDHLDLRAADRALLRRQARQVQRMEVPETTWEGEVPLWLAASHVPEVLRRRRDLHRIAPGCYRVGPAWFSFLWIAANELPLRDELIPFLIARSGRALDEFGRWIITRRPPEWLVRMLRCLPMTTSLREELYKFALEKVDDPEIRERKKSLIKVLVEVTPGVSDELIEKGVEEGLEKGLAPLAHQFERRLGRRLTGDERRALHERLHRVGPDRLGDVVLDLDPEALALWLADADTR